MYLIIIQARMKSTRLPGKVMKEIKNKTVLEWCIHRCKLSKKQNKVIVATSTNKENDIIETLCKELNVDCYRGNENDVLDRYFKIAIQFPDYNFIRITSDCPFVCPYMIDDMIEFYNNNKYDYIINHSDENYITPEGSGIEIFNLKTIKYLWNYNTDMKLREHVTGYLPNTTIFDNFITKGIYNYLPGYLYPNLIKEKLSLDTQTEYEKIVKIAEHFNNMNFSYKDILNLLANTII